jgi:hypothetical protein
LGELGELLEPQSTNRKDFLEECKSGRLNGVLVAFRTFNSISISGPFDEELIQELPDSLKFICHNGESKAQCLSRTGASLLYRSATITNVTFLTSA